MRKFLFSSLLSLLLIPITQGAPVFADQNKSIVQSAVTAIFKDFNAADVEKLLHPDYIQHNPGVPTGRDTILGFLPALKASGLTVETHRVIAEGDFVVMHNTYANATLFGAPKMVGFDVFRVANGQVVEHWDNLAPIAAPNPSGRSQTDGPTAIVDKAKTADNKALVSSFIESVLIGGNFDQLPNFISTTTYHQHNTAIADGLDGLGKAVAAMAQQGITMKYDTLHLVVAEGNFVFTMSEGTFGSKPTSYYDLFRVEGGKIVEHWDIIAEIPTEMAHKNGKFGNIAKYVTGSRDFTGKSYKVDFGMFQFRLDFTSPQDMEWAQIKADGLGPKNAERITRVEVRPNVYMVYWTEKTGTRVTHVQDFARGIVHTNIATADGAFHNLTGSLVEIRK